jgi:hypothetical protein
MQTIAIRLRVMHLSAEMAAMRKWLDEHRCEPSSMPMVGNKSNK